LTKAIFQHYPNIIPSQITSFQKNKKMAKFPKIPKLSKEEQEELIAEFCQALATIKNPQEAVKFLLDLLGRQEIEMLAKRLKIAKLLLKGWKYPEIRRQLKTSQGTIARINLWLKMSGEGYRMIAARTKKEKDPYTEFVKDELKRYLRRYSKYYWPFLLWEEVMANLSRRQKEKFQEVLVRAENKDKIYKEFNLLLKDIYAKKPSLSQELMTEKLKGETQKEKEKKPEEGKEKNLKIRK